MSLNEKSLLTLWCDFTGKQALRSTSGSFAYSHFQLFDVDPDFGFTFWAIQREIKYHCILAYFGSGLTAANRAVNPLGSVLFVVHARFPHIK